MKVAKAVAIRAIPREHRPSEVHGIGIATVDPQTPDAELVEWVTIESHTARTLAEKLLALADDLDAELHELGVAPSLN